MLIRLPVGGRGLAGDIIIFDFGDFERVIGLVSDLFKEENYAHYRLF